MLFGDERCVAPEQDYSNYHMALETLLDHVRIPDNQVHRIQGELRDPAAAAASYEQVLRRVFEGEDAPRSDLVLLGMGDDGHTASLFPETDALAETEKGELAVGRILREDFLQQSAVSDDAFCPLEKSYWMLKVILTFYDRMTEALGRTVPLERAMDPVVLDQLARMRDWPADAVSSCARDLMARIKATYCDME